MQTIFPILRYDDARAAIRSLCDTLGFVEIFSTPQSGPFVRHAQLKLGTNVVMLGSTRPEESMAKAQQALYVYVDDLDAHFERALSAGAEIASPPAATYFGARQYTVRDAEGNHWTFGTYLPP